LPIKDLLITFSFTYLYFYQASNIKRKNKRPPKNNKKINADTGSERESKNEENRMSMDTQGLNEFLNS